MSCVSFLRNVGLWPQRTATDEEVARANTDNALVDNERASQEMHEAYRRIPESSLKLRETIRQAAQATSPFADLERLMHGERSKRARR